MEPVSEPRSVNPVLCCALRRFNARALAASASNAPFGSVVFSAAGAAGGGGGATCAGGEGGDGLLMKLPMIGAIAEINGSAPPIVNS